MPFTARDKPRLIERLRGKTGQDLFNEVKSALNSDSRRMFFDSPTQWSGRETAFPRGFPFDADDDPLPFHSRRSRPFTNPSDWAGSASTSAENIREPPWCDENGPKRRVVETNPSPAPQEPHSVSSPLSHHGLRNTVPLVRPPTSERPARAMSAPPGDRPRFTSTCEIPVGGSDPTPSQQQQQPPPPPSTQQTSNVRVIPIRVEGRDEPLINSNIDTSNFTAEPAFDARMPRDFGNFRKQSARFQQQAPPQAQKPPAAPKSRPMQRPSSKTQANSDEKDEPDKASHSTAQPATDPTTSAMNRIAQVQQEVANLSKLVDASILESRKDKQYVYLDEMLTRQLLNLDNVDPAGNDTVRQSRKDAIRAIQKCISVLESKVPAEPMDVDANVCSEADESEKVSVDGKMGVNETKENESPEKGEPEPSVVDHTPPAEPPA